MRPRVVAFAALIACITASAVSHAEPTPDPKKADDLFTRANQLADSGDFAGACPLYDESNRLDPGIGTQFNLADCYEHTGRLATALGLFRQVERVAGEAGKADRQARAHQRAEALEKLVARVKVVPPATQTPGLEVRFDDRVLGQADFGRPMPVDAGTHTVAARSPGHVSWSRRFDIGEHEGRELDVPELLPEGPVPVATAPAPAPASWSTQKTLAFVTGGIGVAGLGVGAVTGLLSVFEHSAYVNDCVGGTAGIINGVCIHPKPQTSVKSDSSTAVTEGNVSTVAFIVGGVGVAGALALWFTAPKPSERASALRVTPAVAPGYGGLDVLGAF